MEKILGTGLVDRENQRIRIELFSRSRQDELIQALIAPAPEITTFSPLVSTDIGEIQEEEESPESGEGIS